MMRHKQKLHIKT